MKKFVILIGVGEMGSVFARGFLRAGYPVLPILRGMDLKDVAEEIPNPEWVVVAVGEKDLQEVLKGTPRVWQDRLVLLQNELLPRDWQAQRIFHPTVISVWFEKKSGQDVKVIIPSPVFGPAADVVKTALGSIGIPCAVLDREADLLFELVLKNLYILTVNIAGLKVGGTVGELWEKHQPLARGIAEDVLDIQFQMIGQELDRRRLIEGMVRAFHGDRTHQCMGRSAPSRLARAIAQADERGLQVSNLRSVFEGNQRKPAV